MNLDRLEELLETMSPEEIRAQYGEELAKDPRCVAMLAAFEGLDENLKNLRDAVPAPSFRPPKRAWSGMAVKWALPVAAVLVLGMLFGSGLLQKNAASREAAALVERDDAKPAPLTMEVPQGLAKGDAMVDEVGDKASLPNESLQSADGNGAAIGLEKKEGRAVETKEEPPAPKPKRQVSEEAQKFGAERTGTSLNAAPEPRAEPEPLQEALMEEREESPKVSKSRPASEDDRADTARRRAKMVGADRAQQPVNAPEVARQEESTTAMDTEMAVGALEIKSQPEKPSTALSQAFDFKKADLDDRGQALEPEMRDWLKSFGSRLQENRPLADLFEADPMLTWQGMRAAEGMSLEAFAQAWQASSDLFQWQAARITKAGDDRTWQVLLPAQQDGAESARLLTVTLSSQGRCSALAVKVFQQ